MCKIAQKASTHVRKSIIENCIKFTYFSPKTIHIQAKIL